MNNIFFTQYEKSNYPLKKFTLEKIPSTIRQLIYDEKNFNCIARGGLAYTLLTGDKNYFLSDVDLIYPDKNFDDVLNLYAYCAEKIFVNRNTFYAKILTALWQADENFYKVDALFVKDLPEIILLDWAGKKIQSVDFFYLWYDKMLKVAQQKIRGYDEKKIPKHLAAAKNLALIMSESSPPEISRVTYDLKILLSSVIKIAENFLTNEELENFKVAQEKFLSKMRLWNANIILPTALTT